jgi:hypothetical protein
MARYGRDYNRGGWGEDYGNRGYYGGGFSDRGGGDYGYRTGGYGFDRTPNRAGWGSTYDRDYKSRWQTDYGDPFGDRASGTPIRVMRGEFENENVDRGTWRGYDRNHYRGGYTGEHRGDWRSRNTRARYDQGWW